jgi:hypothetical protein
LSDLKKIRVQHVDRDAKGVEIKTDVDVITDADCITMDDGDLRSGVKKMIDDRIGEVIDGAPEELDTLKEIATELEKNQSGVSTIIKKLEAKLDKSVFDEEVKGFRGNIVDLENAMAHNQDVIEEALDDFYEEYKKAIELKVDKVEGKGLSTNDFTDVDKRKLDAIENGAEKNKVTSVNGMTGDVTIEAGNGNVDLSGYAKHDYVSYLYNDLKAEIDVSVRDTYTRLKNEKREEHMDLQKAFYDELDKITELKADKTDIVDFKRCIVISESNYSALSDAEKNRADTLYFLI